MKSKIFIIAILSLVITGSSFYGGFLLGKKKEFTNVELMQEELDAMKEIVEEYEKFVNNIEGMAHAGLIEFKTSDNVHIIDFDDGPMEIQIHSGAVNVEKMDVENADSMYLKLTNYLYVENGFEKESERYIVLNEDSNRESIFLETNNKLIFKLLAKNVVGVAVSKAEKPFKE